MSEINVVPYIDVMLVLLVIFMVTAPLLNEGVKVDLPKASTQTIDSKNGEPVVVSVDAQGLYYLNVADDPREAMPAGDIINRVAAELAVAKEKGEIRQVLVKGDQSVDYGKVIGAMVLLQKAGAETVGLVTEPPAEST
jgi:biopolymer transport protein TolR